MFIFATAVDHVVPHRGNTKLFFDKTNLQSLCDAHHDEKTKIELGHQIRIAVDVDGWPKKSGGRI